VRLAADRAGLRGLGGRIQWVGLSCGNRQPRCRRPAFARWMHLSSRWHLRREMASTAFAPRMPPLFAMASMGGDGIYGVCTTLPPPCAMACGRFHRQMPSRAGMASMGGNGIYGACTALPPPCAMASMA
jgi:hypothetical protein